MEQALIHHPYLTYPPLPPLKKLNHNYFNGPIPLFDSSKKITLLRVIPTMTFIHFLTGKSSGILSDISSDILFDILSGISSGI